MEETLSDTASHLEISELWRKATCSWHSADICIRRYHFYAMAFLKMYTTKRSTLLLSSHSKNQFWMKVLTEHFPLGKSYY